MDTIKSVVLQIGLIQWWAILSAIPLGLFVVLRRNLHRHLPQCSHCGYSLQGLGATGHLCPECGMDPLHTACRVWYLRRKVLMVAVVVWLAIGGLSALCSMGAMNVRLLPDWILVRIAPLHASGSTNALDSSLMSRIQQGRLPVAQNGVLLRRVIEASNQPMLSVEVGAGESTLRVGTTQWLHGRQWRLLRLCLSESPIEEAIDVILTPLDGGVIRGGITTADISFPIDVEIASSTMVRGHAHLFDVMTNPVEKQVSEDELLLVGECEFEVRVTRLPSK